MPTGAELFVDAIEKRGIREIFTLVGDHLNDVLLCAGQRGLRILDMRHEAAVVHAADAWARITRRPSLSLVTGGPGHTNSLTGIATAFLAAVQSSRSAEPRLDAGSARSISGHRSNGNDAIGCQVGGRADKRDTDSVLRRSRLFAEAMSGRPGPVHLTIPVDLFAANTVSPIPDTGAEPPTAPSPSADDIDKPLRTPEERRASGHHRGFRRMVV